MTAFSRLYSEMITVNAGPLVLLFVNKPVSYWMNHMGIMFLANVIQWTHRVYSTPCSRPFANKPRTWEHVLESRTYYPAGKTPGVPKAMANAKMRETDLTFAYQTLKTSLNVAKLPKTVLHIHIQNSPNNIDWTWKNECTTKLGHWMHVTVCELAIEVVWDLGTRTVPERVLVYSTRWRTSFSVGGVAHKPTKLRWPNLKYIA